MNNNWKPFEQAPKDGTKFFAWHKIHKIPIVIYYLEQGVILKGNKFHWIEGTMTHAWPEEAFTAYMEIPEELIYES